jgi:hypothetical protein
MSPSPGPGNSDRFRQYLENLGRDIEPGSGFFSPDTVFWRVSREPALLFAVASNSRQWAKIVPIPYVA